MTIKRQTTARGIEMTTPYNPDIAKRFREMGGKWDPEKKVWVIRETLEEQLDALLLATYGTTGKVGGKLVTIRIRATEALSVKCGPVTFSGRPVFKAVDRDSGARVCDGVSLVEGKMTSGGSRQYWTSECTAGSIFEIEDMPESFNASKEFEVLSVVEKGKIDRDALEAEREALVKRIAEIDAALAAA